MLHGVAWHAFLTIACAPLACRRARLHGGEDSDEWEEQWGEVGSVCLFPFLLPGGSWWGTGVFDVPSFVLVEAVNAQGCFA